MNHVFDPLNLLILAVAVVIFFRLRGVLGTRTGHEKRYDPISTPDTVEPGRRPSKRDNVVRLPDRGESPVATGIEEPAQPVWHGYAADGSAAAAGLEAIAQADEDFSPAEFVQGARAAYEMIVTAFADGDKSTLKPLLSREVFDGFAGAIDQRKKLGHTLESRFVGINKADIETAGLAGHRATITMKFVSELITATRDRDGAVVDGDPSTIQEITDVWTFERDVSSRDPNWRLIATEALA